jgi:hypothetical protein
MNTINYQVLLQGWALHGLRDWSYSYAYLEFWGVFICHIRVFSLFLGIGQPTLN